VVEMLREERGRIREKLRDPLNPCRYYPECKFKRSIGEDDYCSDGSLVRQRPEEVLRGASD